MPERPQAVLRLEPHQIPALRAAFTDAAGATADAVAQLRTSGVLSSPWMADPVSEKVRTIYNQRVIDAPESAYQHLCAYHDELLKVVRSLERMAADYSSTEGATAAMWGAQA